MKLIGRDGNPLVATFDIRVEPQHLALIFHSAGGAARSGGVARNRDYPLALEVLLERLRALDATLVDALVDSQVVTSLLEAERRLTLGGRTFPILLRSEQDLHDLRLALTRAQGPIGRAQNVRGAPGGNERKRIRLLLQVPGFVSSTRDARRLELALGGHADLSEQNRDPSTPPRIAPDARSRTGQGRSADPVLNKAVEVAAVAEAMAHYRRHGWDVEDVGATRSYDLHCTRGGDVKRVEVKGTTTDGAFVRLTPNEVAQAAAGGSVALFVVSEIAVTWSNGEPACSGGQTLVLDPWEIDTTRLTPTGYTYALDL